jgi:alpha-beta hydrolase superfamily lysophospholipase
MSCQDAGLAHEYWKQYFTPAETEEVIANRSTTMLASGHYPIHVGLYVQARTAPTVLMAHGLFVYGLTLARLQLPFFRAGFNVVEWDLPGMGQSGGPRGGCTILEYIRAWGDALEFAHRRFGEPLYALGVAEDGVTCYYALANSPKVKALSLHTLLEVGDYEGMHWHGPRWWMRMVTAALQVAAIASPSISRPSASIVPLEWIFEGSGDQRVVDLLQHDPLSFKRVTLRMVSRLGKRLPAPVPYEACHTPVQLIASENNHIWRYDSLVRNYQRLGGPKQLITLRGVGQWDYNPEFAEMYAAHVIRWFKSNGGQMAQ